MTEHSANTLPRTKPTWKPKGWPNPRHENATFRVFPWANVAVMILTAVGKHNAAPTPWIAPKTMSWFLVLAPPDAAMKMPSIKVPARLMFRLPTRSATAPARSKQHPQPSISYSLTSSVAKDVEHTLTNILSRAYRLFSVHKPFELQNPVKTDHRIKWLGRWMSAAIIGMPILTKPVLIERTN